MKCNLITFFFCTCTIIASAQLAGKKFKTPYKSIDNHNYKVGEVIKIGTPSKGKMFEQIATYRKTTFLETMSAVAGTASNVSTAVATKGRDFGSSTVKAAESPFALVDNSFSNQPATIDYFSFYEDKKEPKNNSTFVVAKMVNNPDVVIAFNMELAIKNGEMYSNNPEYQKVTTVSPTLQNDSTSLTQFSSKIHTQFLSAVGNKDKQTVTLNLLLSHKTVHQILRLDSDDNSAYDLDGNEYKSSNVTIGSESSTYRVKNRIPTNVPVRISVTMNKILPEVKLLRFVSIKVYYDDEANTTYPDANKGSLEIKNVKVNWQ